MDFQFIDPDKIQNMLFHDAGYIIEFCEAGITSFEDFVDHYSHNLLARNMEDLRKAGHKIKPGAQMMGADEVVDEYEHAKSLLNNNAGSDQLKESIKKMTSICTSIQDELSHLAKIQN